MFIKLYLMRGGAVTGWMETVTVRYLNMPLGIIQWSCVS